MIVADTSSFANFLQESFLGRMSIDDKGILDSRASHCIAPGDQDMGFHNIGQVIFAELVQATEEYFGGQECETRVVDGLGITIRSDETNEHAVTITVFTDRIRIALKTMQRPL